MALKKIITAGVLRQPFGSFPVVTQSDDGETWDPLTIPFDINHSPTAIAVSSNTVAVTNEIGQVAVSNDMTTWNRSTIYDGLMVSSMVHADSKWFAAGQQYLINSYGPYNAHLDLAQIHMATDPMGPWAMIWTNPQVDSVIYQMKWFEMAPVDSSTTANVLVATGSVGAVGEIWYSLDSGNSWIQGAAPAIGRIYSVELVSIGSDKFWYWGSRGKLYRSDNLQDTNWNQISIDTTKNVTAIVASETDLVIAADSEILSSKNGATFVKWSNSGYNFSKLAKLDTGLSVVWLLFSSSMLTQWTYWSTIDFESFVPNNNNVQVTCSIVTV